MKKLIFILLCLTGMNSYASNIKDAEYAFNVESAFASKKITDKTYITKLKKCSDVGNKACMTLLGSFYLTTDHKNFTEAYRLLSKASDDFDGIPEISQLANFYLGKMYYFGWGVLQNDNKAIQFFSKSAQAGYKSAAYSVATIYALNEIINEVKTERNLNNKYKPTNIEYYAWLKVADALPGEIMSAWDFDVSSSQLKKQIQIAIYTMSTLELEKADKLATQICSKITRCIQ